ncbi:enoyl-CoA hydratase/isomerase family protein [Rhodococcus opacus]|uniref:enoyl-CoA hydratase/isomerase family protein n=1 Tax=Rhodococcus opacus TaxID=37919 RepID=UPI001C47F731|nr:enoyl-CoA hydratase/isomerase family protein [Rhodococcus opacus]MBV6759076.1 enoyl-CoA hydratase/isomerase family protein [Rhodococcus opacus]
MTDHELPLMDLDDGILTITFNRPAKLNALTMDIYRWVARTVGEAADDPAVKAILFRGKGTSFSSGFDLKDEMAPADLREHRAQLHSVANAMRWTIWNSPKPTIAAIHGYCLAGAFELVLPMDFAIATESAKLGEPEILFGAGPAFAMVPWMMNHKQAKDVLLTGRHLSAQEAHHLGLVNAVVSESELDNAVAALADRFRRLSPAAVEMSKLLVNRVSEGQGLHAHINSSLDAGMHLAFVSHEPSNEFAERVRKNGAGAGIKWRREFFDTDNTATRLD